MCSCALARIPGPAMPLAEAQMAMGGQRLHPELGGEGERLPVVLLGRGQPGCVGRVALGRDLAVEPPDPRLVPALASLPRQSEGPLRLLARVPHAARA